MQPIEALIFDLDGTLVDSKDDVAAAVNYALRMLGRLPLPHSQLHTYIGNGSRALLASALVGERLREDPEGDLARQVAEAMPHYMDYYQEHPIDRTRLFPGAAEALTEFDRRGKRMAVATNKDSGLTRQILTELGILERFRLILGPGDVARRKPHRESVDRILQELGVSADRVAMVGDSEVDMATGRNAGIPVYGVSYGHGGRAALQEKGAAAVVDDLRELLDIIP